MTVAVIPFVEKVAVPATELATRKVSGVTAVTVKEPLNEPLDAPPTLAIVTDQPTCKKWGVWVV